MNYKQIFKQRITFRRHIYLHVENMFAYHWVLCKIIDISVSDTLYQDKLTTDKKPTVVYSIPDEIPTTCFQLCELV